MQLIRPWNERVPSVSRLPGGSSAPTPSRVTSTSSRPRVRSSMHRSAALVLPQRSAPGTAITPVALSPTWGVAKVLLLLVGNVSMKGAPTGSQTTTPKFCTTPLPSRSSTPLGRPSPL